MNTATNFLVQKLWNYCDVLSDDGMSYGDYAEQLTYLLFLKMADERSAPPYNQPSIVPATYAWPTLLAKDGAELFSHYRHLLEKMRQEKGTRGLIFGKAQNKFHDPAKLRCVIVDLIDTETRSNWVPTSKSTPTKRCWRKRRWTPKAIRPLPRTTQAWFRLIADNLSLS